MGKIMANSKPRLLLRHPLERELVKRRLHHVDAPRSVWVCVVYMGVSPVTSSSRDDGRWTGSVL